MTTTGLLSVVPVLPRLAGPLLLKELRAASRQRRYYVLRCAYVGLLLVVVLQLWLVVVHVGTAGSTVVQASRLAAAGKSIVATIVWVQFITGQILAVVLLSDAISGEIRKRTLETLLVSPLGVWRIVTGKLLSRLLQLVLLLSISLPLLAVVRVFGGVPWDYVISGFCITLTAAVFAGSLSLFSSVRHRHAHEAVVLVGLWYLVIWGILSGVWLSLARVQYLPKAAGTSVLFLTNPPMALAMQTHAMLGAAGSTGVRSLWPLHCLIILAAASILLAVSVWRIRRITRARRWGQAGGSAEGTNVLQPGTRPSFWQSRRAARPIRRVKGPPVQWKELQTPLFRSRWRLLFHTGLAVVIAGFVLVLVALFGRVMGGILFIPIQILQLLLVIDLAVAAGGAITREKEGRTWPILLATPLSSRQIVKGKALGAFHKNLPLLASLGGTYLLVALLGPVHQSGLVFTVALSLVGMVLFLLGVGLYLSVRLRTTTAAVAATLGLYFVPKLFCCGGFGSALFLATGPRMGGPSLLSLLVISVIPVLAYVIAGLLCLRAATRRLRRNVF
jgi:ABC-2 type transport system permease protein